jgi:ribose transport system permease protein
MAFGALLIIFIGFSLASPYFFTFRNVIGILISTAVNGLLAIGVTFIIISGGIDLSVGTVMTLSAIMSGVFITYWNLPVPLGVMAGILTGSSAGFVNGILISKLKLPPFIATLGMLNVARGFSLVISKLSPIYFALDKPFSSIAMGSIMGKIIPGFEIPNAVLIMFGSAIIAGLILSKTILGRYCYAIGSNEKAVQLSGVNIVFWKTAIYTVAGIFVGIAGVVIAARLNSAQPSLGLGYELEAIAAAVIGAVEKERYWAPSSVRLLSARSQTACVLCPYRKSGRSLSPASSLFLRCIWIFSAVESNHEKAGKSYLIMI